MFQMNIKGIFLIFLSRLKEMFSFITVTYIKPLCPIQTLSHPTPFSPTCSRYYWAFLNILFFFFKSIFPFIRNSQTGMDLKIVLNWRFD